MGAYRKNLLLQIGPITTSVNLHTVVPSSRPSARLVCPEHVTPLKQQYFCPIGEHVIPWGSWDKAIETPEGWRKVDPATRPTMEKASSILELTPVPTKEVEANTFEGESIYWLEPSNEGSMDTWSILIQQMKTGKVTFMTRGGFRQGAIEKLWKLELFRDYPVLREVVFPDSINAHPANEPTKVDKDTKSLVDAFIQARMTGWDDIDTTDRFKDALELWISSGELVGVVDDKEEPQQSHNDLIAQLEAAVAKAKNK